MKKPRHKEPTNGLKSERLRCATSLATPGPKPSQRYEKAIISAVRQAWKTQAEAVAFVNEHRSQDHTKQTKRGAPELYGFQDTNMYTHAQMT